MGEWGSAEYRVVGDESCGLGRQGRGKEREREREEERRGRGERDVSHRTASHIVLCRLIVDEGMLVDPVAERSTRRGQ